MTIVVLACVAWGCTTEPHLVIPGGTEIGEGEIERVYLKEGGESIKAGDALVESSDPGVASIVIHGKSFFILAHQPGRTTLRARYQREWTEALEVLVIEQ